MKFASLILLALVAPSGWTKSSEGIEIGQRVVAAIKGKAEFQDSDFLKPLTTQDKMALRQFGACKVRYVHHTGTSLPDKPLVVVEDPSEIGIGFDCKGVPDSMPVGISLHLQDGKIAKIETHNADLMKVNR